MKILFLNTWNGTMKENITDFLTKQFQDMDIFCLQETYADSVPLWKNIFLNYQELTANKFIGEEGEFAQTTYFHDGMKVISSQVLFGEQKDCGLAIYLEIEKNNKIFHVCNFHGLAYPGDKRDTPNRLRQSQGLIDFLKDKKGFKIIGGDFNLSFNTESIEMFEEHGYRNLIKDSDIQTTRNHFAWDQFPSNKQFYADYVFVSQDVNVKNFSVIENEVSDHLPLILEIEV